MAETQVRKSLQFNPYNIYALDLLSDILIQRNDKNEFVSSLQKLFWLSPGFYYYRLKMADFYYFEKNWMKSAYYYRIGIANAEGIPVNPESFYRYAESSFYLGDFITAGRYYDSCLHYNWTAEYRTEIIKNREKCYSEYYQRAWPEKDQ